VFSFSQELFNCRLELRNVLLYCDPHKPEIDSEVVMCTPVAHARDLAPRDFTPPSFGVLREVLDRPMTSGFLSRASCRILSVMNASRPTLAYCSMS
jgi:hypothetical protein